MLVAQRFPQGGKELEPFVIEARRVRASDATPFGIVWDRIARELGLAP